MGNNNFVFNYGYPPYGYPQNTNQYFEQQIEKKNDKKILKTIGVACGISIIIYFAGSTLLGLIIGLLYDKFPKIGFVFGEGMGSWAFSSIVTVLFIGIPFLVSYFVLRKKKITGIIPLGTTYNKKASTYMVMFFLPLTLISTFAINLVSIIVQTILGISFSTGADDLAVGSVSEFLFMTLSVAVIPAILEEVTIRGVLLQPLRRFGDVFAILVSALVFSLLHGNMVQVPYTIVAGIYFGYVAVATGSLWPSIILHFLNNFYSVVITTVASNLSVGVSGVATIGILGLMVAIGIFGFVKYRAMNYKVKMAKGVKSLKAGEKISSVFINVPMIIAMIIMVITTLSSISSAAYYE